tara:strand:- start:534 stop:950 length:417 start_codon:yes stop_codon:yes gene_type:complete
MKPWQEAKKWHIENESEWEFEQLLGAYLNDGFVWSSPTEFVCFKKVRVKDGKLKDGKPNAWYVGFMAGENLSPDKLMSLAPHPMKWVCWHRGTQANQFYCFKWDKLKGRTNGILSTKSKHSPGKGLRQRDARHAASPG